MTEPPKSTTKNVVALSTAYTQTGVSKRNNALGMRPMQERAYEKRGEQYLLIKSPPASGKSRALMFIALDKVFKQGLKQALIIVPERSIGSSFYDEPLSKFGFWADWEVKPRWNLCDASGHDDGKVKALEAFLASEDSYLICTHATFRFAFEALGPEAFDGRLLAVDEFHHVSANPDNVLGNQLAEIIERDKTHIVAMTGSYFRGDAEAVLHPEDEAKFETVTYTYYEQLNGYEYLKKLDLHYCFYSGVYTESIAKVLDSTKKTIVHIPSVNSRESTQDKFREVNDIIEALGTWEGVDPKTGFQLVRTLDGRQLRVADLVDDELIKRSKVVQALTDPEQHDNRDHVDIIIALGMAKEGFDWIWCEHALTVGYRASLTEVVQIIGRTTRDAKGKVQARFTNLIAELDASEELVSEAVNDTLKAISVSLLMEQVLAPRFDFQPKERGSGPTPGVDYGPEGYQEGKTNIGVDKKTGQVEIEIGGLKPPKSEEAQRVCKEDLNEVIAAFTQESEVIERGVFDPNTMPQELTQAKMGKIVESRYPHMTDDDQEAIRQHAIAKMNISQQGWKLSIAGEGEETGVESSDESAALEQREQYNTAFIDGVRRFIVDVRELDIDLIDSINPFSEAYSILSKSMDEKSLRTIESVISAKRVKISPDEAKELAIRARQFIAAQGRNPSATSMDPWEQRLAQGASAFMRYLNEGRYEEK